MGSLDSSHIKVLKSSVYSWEYSEWVVDGFINKYSRVMTFVAKKLGMPMKHVRLYYVDLFRSKNAKFQILRETLKRIHKQDLYADLARLDRADFLKYLTSVRTLVEDDWLDDTFAQNNT